MREIDTTSYIDRKQVEDHNIFDMIKSNMEDVDFMLDLDETFRKIRSFINGMINAHNSNENAIARNINLTIIKEVELLLITKGIVLNFDKQQSTDIIPRVNSVTHSHRTTVPSIADKYDYGELRGVNVNTLNKPDSKYDIDQYVYDFQNDIKSLHGYLLIPNAQYKEFIKSINGKMYIHSNELSGKRLQSAVDSERDFVGEIIYADKEILRIRSKARYNSKYNGVEDYIYMRGKNPQFDNFITHHLIYKTLESIPRNLRGLKSRAIYLSRISDSYGLSYLDPEALWGNKTRRELTK